MLPPATPAALSPPPPSNHLRPALLEARAGHFWELFYQRNGSAFFRDRHYLASEFPALATGPHTVLEARRAVETGFVTYSGN